MPTPAATPAETAPATPAPTPSEAAPEAATSGPTPSEAAPEAVAPAPPQAAPAATNTSANDTPALDGSDESKAADATARAEPSTRLTAYQAAAATAMAAGRCRYHGDDPGPIPVVVEFGNDGQVQRTMIKATLHNPMTSKCISAQLGKASVPAFSGDPIIVTAEVSLR
jgi:hypothetical protein